ncbi:hypothetical protein [Terrabacter terrigena]|uniref:Uncharacterized protein n=1 Tax=Terrabacter terrigena TaxID=574718 RepID=A0ABW3MYZ3_9MICO
MTAQPTAPPRSDVEVLEALDFQPAPPCEWLLTGQPCGAPADLLVVNRSRCGCPNPPIPTCAPCWARLGQLAPACWHCGRCNVHIGRSRDETLVIVCHLRGGRP